MRTELVQRNAGQERRMQVAELTHLEASCKYVDAHGSGGSLVLDESLASLEAEFGDLLLRTHRAVLVVRSRAAELLRETGDNPRYMLRVEGASEPVRVSRRYVAKVRKELQA